MFCVADMPLTALGRLSSRIISPSGLASSATTLGCQARQPAEPSFTSTSRRTPILVGNTSTSETAMSPTATVIATWRERQDQICRLPMTPRWRNSCVRLMITGDSLGFTGKFSYTKLSYKVSCFGTQPGETYIQVRHFAYQTDPSPRQGSLRSHPG